MGVLVRLRSFSDQNVLPVEFPMGRVSEVFSPVESAIKPRTELIAPMFVMCSCGAMYPEGHHHGIFRVYNDFF
jgi:hypothetical protein